MILPLLALAAVGHVVLWVAVVNRLHAIAIRRRWIDLATLLSGLLLVALPVAIAPLVIGGSFDAGLAETGAAVAMAGVYLATCAMLALVTAGNWLRLRWHRERRGALLSNHTVRIDLAQCLAGPLTAPGWPTWLARLPGNELLKLEFHEKQITLPRLPEALEGFRIAHLTDLHMSGRLARSYFEEVAERTNQARPDLVAVTGDLVENSACIDWIPETLGRLRARYGVYVILGNHDRRVDKRRLISELTEAGLVHVGGCTSRVAVEGAEIELAGNELPWYGPAPDLEIGAEGDEENSLRILLSHSPDQFGWAQTRRVDLMLAGHNHGGQVCLPVLGPLLAPSWFGTRYAAGVFRAGGTVMHVSRGTACYSPIRFRCPPEIALLVLRGAR